MNTFKESFLKNIGVATALTFATPSFAKVDANTMFKQLAHHEGIKHSVYTDSLGNPTIGVGFNLKDKENQKLLSQLGITSADIKNGLDDWQIKQLFDISLKRATKDAYKFIPNLDKHPISVQRAVIDMSFNLGYIKLNKFVQFKKALVDKNYPKASQEMLNSNWARQTGQRARELAQLVMNAS